jgi:hypothetical protein
VHSGDWWTRWSMEGDVDRKGDDAATFEGLVTTPRQS